ncbi:TRAP transporter substrate-binding protein [Afifella pfennigii]|uniref:TRAP transporter substrate-binding protein n=1 Tax=Afifella pfennigii TaxID=209897 RepID=UPI000556CD86|nr:TRAP transporter substrate-binding protein [Afifella pfennigii]
MKLKLLGAMAVATALACTGAAAQDVTLHMGHNNQTDHPGHIAGLEFAKLVEEGTNGAVKVVVYPAEQLANVRAGTEGLQLGTIDLYYVDAGTLGNWHPEYAFVSLPFLFDDFDHAVEAMDSIDAELSEKMREDFNVERLGWTPAGFRVILTKDKPVASAADMAGVKMRVPEIPMYVSTFTALGANATPLPWGDVYSALQTGVVEGVEGPAPAILSGGFQEVVTHAAPTRHIMTDLALLMNLDKFNALTPEQQQVVRDAGKQAFNVTFRKLMKEADQAAYEEISADLAQPEDLDVQSFRTAVEPVVEEFLAEAGSEVGDWVARIQEQ